MRRGTGLSTYLRRWLEPPPPVWVQRAFGPYPPHSGSQSYNALGEVHRTPRSGPAFALGRTPGTCKESRCLDRHIRTVLGSQFFHDMANMNFDSALGNV